MTLTTRDLVTVGTSASTNAAYGAGGNGAGVGGTPDVYRSGVLLSNCSGSGQIIYVNFGATDPTTSNYDIQLKAGEFQFIDVVDTSIRTIASGASAQLVIREYRRTSEP
jgi:hypothetical protein